MIVNARIGINQNRVARIISNLKRAQTPAVLAKFDSLTYGRKAVAHLKLIFPQSGKPSQEYGHPLRGGWSVRAIPGKGVGFDIYHRASNSSKVRKILALLDVGTIAHTFTVRAKQVFFGRRISGTEGFVTLRAGRQIFMPAHAPLDYTGRTYRYILDVLLPEMKVDINALAKTEIEA